MLSAIGLPQKLAKASIRLGFGRYTTMDEIEKAGAIINDAAKAQGQASIQLIQAAVGAATPAQPSASVGNNVNIKV